MTDYLALAAIPVAGWTINRVIQHGQAIAVLQQVAVDIRNSLQRLEAHLDAQSQSGGNPQDARHRGSRS